MFRMSLNCSTQLLLILVRELKTIDTFLVKFCSFVYFLGKLGDEALSRLTEESYNAMTANGDVKLRKG